MVVHVHRSTARHSSICAVLLVALHGCSAEGYVGHWAAAPVGSASDAEVNSLDDVASGQPQSDVDRAGAAAPLAKPTNCEQARDEDTRLEVTVVDTNALVYNFADGAVFPGGHYQISYVDGCRMYDDTAAWTLHASLLASGLSSQGRAGCYLVMSNGQPLDIAPGTTGLLVGEGVEPAGAFATYRECVAANRKLPALDVTFAGGTLGVMNAGDSTANKTPGEAVGGRSPTYRLTRVDDCP